MKKALALILAVCMLFSCAVMVSAAEGTSPAVQDSQDSGSQDSGNASADILSEQDIDSAG